MLIMKIKYVGMCFFACPIFMFILIHTDILLRDIQT